MQNLQMNGYNICVIDKILDVKKAKLRNREKSKNDVFLVLSWETKLFYP